MFYGAVIDESAKEMQEMLSIRVGELSRPLPEIPDVKLAGMAVMFRDSLDLAHGELISMTSAIERMTAAIRPLTENKKRKHIIPATPSVREVKSTVLKLSAVLDSRCEPWMVEDANGQEFRSVFNTERLDYFLGGRDILYGVGSTQVQLGRLLIAIEGLESQWGSFDIWIRNQEAAQISALARSLIRREEDAQEILDDIFSSAYGVSQNPRDAIVRASIKGAIADLLWNFGAGPNSDFSDFEQLLRTVKEKQWQRDRVRAIELDDAPVISLHAIENKKSDERFSPEPMNAEPPLICALASRKLDQRYIQLRFVEHLPPRVIWNELNSTLSGPLSKSEFEALQHRCNVRINRLRKAVPPTTRSPRACRDEIRRAIDHLNIKN